MREPESPDYDSAETVIEPDSEPMITAEGIHAFPGGTHAGTCLHRILEKLDFADPDLIGPTVNEALSIFGIEDFGDVVSNTIETTLAIPLGTPTFRLSEIQKSSRLSELEFTFPINGLTATRLHRLLAQNFGSDFYIFLRGVDATDPASGVFSHRPALGFVEAMNHILNDDN